MSSIDLIKENKRLSKELLFANQCLNVLIEFKTFVDSVLESILEHNLNENQCKKYKQLNKRVFEVFSKRGNELNSNQIVIKSDEIRDYLKSIQSINSQYERISGNLSLETLLASNFV